MVFKKLSQDKFDMKKWEKLLVEEMEAKKELEKNRIPMPQSDGSVIQVARFELIKKLFEATEKQNEYIRSCLE